MALGFTQASNRNEYQECFLAVGGDKPRPARKSDTPIYEPVV
jgi:hypothetical protein